MAKKLHQYDTPPPEMVVASTALITALKPVKHDAFCDRFATERQPQNPAPTLRLYRAELDPVPVGRATLTGRLLMI